MSDYLEAIRDKPIVYIPLMRRGDPKKIVRARLRQKAVSQLLEILPRVGLLVENSELIDAVRDLERQNPVGPRAITEFDEIFKHGFRTIVRALVKSVKSAKNRAGQSSLFNWVETFTEPMLIVWVQHSRTLRLSVLERVTDDDPWNELVEFVKVYGAELFSQKFLTYPNVRAILHQGVENWLTTVREQGEVEFRLLDEIGTVIPMERAVWHLTLILEAIAENYGEYSDYNSTTTQSDHGDLLYTLLDFLRLRMKYDRIAWHLYPVTWAHDILVEENKINVAKQWRRSLSERVRGEADKYVEQLAELQKKYSMQMPTIVDRVNERFVKPMHIDRMKALIPKAMRDPGGNSAQAAFEMLEREIENLTENPSGVGLEIPQWIEALQEEVERESSKQYREIDDVDLWVPIWKPIDPKDVSFQLETISNIYLHREQKDDE